MKQLDPIEHERHKTEAETVLGKEEDDIARLPRDLTFEVDAEAPAAGDRERAMDSEPDSWEVRGDYVVRIHRNPHIHLFIPSDSIDPPLIPIDRIDVVRVTSTDLETVDERMVEDCWTGRSSDDHRRLSARWTGEARFEVTPEDCGPGYHMVGGRVTRRQASKMPDDIWPAIWNTMSRTRRERAL